MAVSAPARTYGELIRVGDAWVIPAVEPHVAIRLKQLFARIPRASAPPYVFPQNAATEADLDWFTSRYPMTMSAQDREALTTGRLRFDATCAEMERVLAADYVPPPTVGLRDGQVLRHYQAQAVAVPNGSGGLLLGDEVGLGKTYTAAAACLLPDALPAVVVCHPHLSAQWCNVIQRFTTLRAHAIRGTKPYRLPSADVYVFRYSNIFGWADVFGQIGPRLAIFDEVQELRRGVGRPGSPVAKGMAARRLAETARLRLGLSATPIYNYGDEVWEIMEFLRPTLLGEKFDFQREWCGGAGSVRDPAALGTYLREQYAFLRRNKRDVGQEVPPVNHVVDLVGHDELTLSSIEDRARALAVRTTTGEFTERGTAARELDMLVRQATGISKARAVADFARILVEGGEPIVLLGWHREVYAIWLQALEDLRPAMYTGSETAAEKGRAASRFLNGETDVLIMSLRSGAGLDGLQRRSSTMVFGELDWSPGVHHQCIGRLDREGQTAPVTAIFLVTDDGSDPPMMEVLGLKASEASRIVDPHLGVTAVHSDYSHVKRLVQRYLDRHAKSRRAPAPDAGKSFAEVARDEAPDMFTGAA